MTFFSVLRENYNAVDRVMKAGDLVFVDYGAAEYNMYTADLCRTWPVSGRFTPEQRKYYDIVLEVPQIRQWATALGSHVTYVAIEGARHDVILSLTEPREKAYAEIDRWLGTYVDAD